MRSYFRNYCGTDIKNCPFCGGFAKLEGKSKTMIKGELKYVTYVRCTLCDSRGKRVLLNYDNYDDGVAGARLEAVRSWNERLSDVG